MQAFIAAIVAFFLGLFGHGVAVQTIHSLLVPAVGQEAQVIFVGDMMFDRTVRSTIDQKGGDFIFSCVDPYFSRADLVVGNLEGPITATSSRSLGSAIGSSDNYVFTFPPSTAPLLYKHNVRAVNIGNNHIENFGNDGVRSTEHYLSNAGVQYFGDPIAQTVATTSIKGVPLAFINYDEFVRGGKASTTLSQIRAAKAAGELPVVFAHWGIEYATSSPSYLHDLAHTFVDAGAVLVVGSHPHVVEEHELYRGVNIYYSLGNFIFDQYFDNSVDHGLMLGVGFMHSGVSNVQEIPVVLQHDRRTCPVVSSSS